MEKKNNPQKKFTLPELEAVYQLVKKYQENASDDYEEEIDKKILQSLIKKLRECMPKEDKKEIDKDFLRQKYHTYNNQINEKVYRTLKNALQQMRTVEISYFSMDNAEFKKREVDMYYTSAKYTIGYCHLRKEIRKFRTSRIRSAKFTDKIYEIPKDFDKNKC